MNEYSLRIADDGTRIIVSCEAVDGTPTTFFQRLNIDFHPIKVALVKSRNVSVIAYFPSPTSINMTAPQEDAICQALEELLQNE